MRIVVDTNVAIAANGRNTHASEECQLSCIALLSMLAKGRKGEVVILDDLGLIFDEYSYHLSYHGQPGVGDIFFKYLHDNKHTQKSVQLVTITPNNDDATGFEELPINPIDKSDRKFLAVALVSNAEIVNALDTDWHEQHAFVTQVGVNTRQLCPIHGCAVNVA